MCSEVGLLASPEEILQHRVEVLASDLSLLEQERKRKRKSIIDRARMDTEVLELVLHEENSIGLSTLPGAAAVFTGLT